MGNILIKKFTNTERDLLERLLSPIEYPQDGYCQYIDKLKTILTDIKGMLHDVTPYQNLSFTEPNAYGVIKFLNLPVDKKIPMPPIKGGYQKRIVKPSYFSENLLVLFSLIFGEPYSMFCEGKGLVNNLIPCHKAKNDLTGLGYDSELGFHIENAALRFLPTHNATPKVLLLSGVRQQESPPYTSVSDTRKAITLLSKEDIKLLFSPLYTVKLPYRWRKSARYNEIKTKLIPILEYEDNCLTANVAFYGDMLQNIASLKAKRALDNFIAALQEVQENTIISPGEILCIDNRVVYHSRTQFEAKFDEHNRAHRWVQRVYVRDNLDSFSDWKEHDERVYSPTF